MDIIATFVASLLADYEVDASSNLSQALSL